MYMMWRKPSMIAALSKEGSLVVLSILKYGIRSFAPICRPILRSVRPVLARCAPFTRERRRLREYCVSALRFRDGAFSSTSPAAAAASA